MLPLSGGVDFAPVPSSTELRFSSESQRLCVDITPVNDDSVESDELFTAVLSTNQERVTFTASLAVITILDDEGMCYLLLFHMSSHLLCDCIHLYRFLCWV